MSQRLFVLSVLAGFVVLGCGVYCLIWFKPAETSFWNPDVAITCWLYCATLSHYWGIATLASGLLPIVGVVLIKTGVRKLGGMLAISAGVAILPLGLLPIIAGAIALKEENSKSQ